MGECGLQLRLRFGGAFRTEAYVGLAVIMPVDVGGDGHCGCHGVPGLAYDQYIYYKVPESRHEMTGLLVFLGDPQGIVDLILTGDEVVMLV